MNRWASREAARAARTGILLNDTVPLNISDTLIDRKNVGEIFDPNSIPRPEAETLAAVRLEHAMTGGYALSGWQEDGEADIINPSTLSVKDRHIERTPMKKHLLTCFIILLALPLTSAQESNTQALDLIRQTIDALGGEKFLNWQDYTSNGRFYAIKGSQKSWTKFWEEYKWWGKYRINFGKEEGAMAEVYNLELNKGWDYEFGKVKDKSEEDIRKYAVSERRDPRYLFREGWKQEGMKVFFLGPENFDTIEPQVALEFLNAENLSVTVFYQEGSHVPYKIIYKERNENGIMQEKEQMFFRWFHIQGIYSPMRIEFYTNGERSGLLEYSEIQYNTGIPDSIFQRPLPKEK